ncbi:GSCFA domain-containing protein [Enterovirga rhinocerotis]|uniref:Tetratricopeptide repeat protein n=1 Tax=Enterovirga rhinocerotis TaxID=1339210 RepID=A0A4R7BTJ3_9HYPH|nr:GSCFA domain-containing protein [Enterovirga rhinocerotis]TDR89064.1 tetratricopeptide repeat protein [Enterovirga rhinocerotis]
MPIRRYSAETAFRTLKDNPAGQWPRRDDPENRFAHFADPFFRPSFTFQPGQRIFTIGSCFARNIEEALFDRGFDVPTWACAKDETVDWGSDGISALNNYVPTCIPAQIRWAFGMEPFDLQTHTLELMPGRFFDPQFRLTTRPLPAEAVLARRERVNRLYRELAQSQFVLITLGLIEAWFDHKSGLYINCAPPKSATRAEPDRFELHVLGHDEVVASLRDLMGLLDQVCPPDYRMILTVSPVPLTATFTPADVAIANCYSKSVLRAACEVLVAERANIDYFASYESVTLTDRSLAFRDDQIHVQPAIVRFNVDRMIRRYVPGADEETVKGVVEAAREEMRAGLFRVGLRRLQDATARFPDDVVLLRSLGSALLRAGSEAQGEETLLALTRRGRGDPASSIRLAGFYNEAGRHAEAAEQAEKAAALGRTGVNVSLERAKAYYHLGRFEEGRSLLDTVRADPISGPLVVYWKAMFCEALGQFEEAEAHFRECNGAAEAASYRTGFAKFLLARGRIDEASEWNDRALRSAPLNTDALGLRVQIAGGRAAAPFRRGGRHVIGGLWRRLKRAGVGLQAGRGD